MRRSGWLRGAAVVTACIIGGVALAALVLMVRIERFLPSDMTGSASKAPEVAAAPSAPPADGEVVSEAGRGASSVPVLIESEEDEDVGPIEQVAVDVTPKSPVPAEVVEDCRNSFVGVTTEEMRIQRNGELGPIGFSIRVRGYENSHPLMSTMAAKGEALKVEILAGEGRDPGAFKVEADGGEVAEADAGTYHWTVPEQPGITCLRMVELASGDTMCLHALVCVPYRGEAVLDGYRIGKYRDEPLKDNPRYDKPTGLIRVTEEDAGAWVSPHFRLGQFLCKQEANWPKYALLETRLLLKLEALIEGLKERGVETDTLFITSGYRTPWYNRSIGNTTDYSRHLYGDAADVFVDTEGDGKLDDLNKDGVSDDKDTQFLYRVVEEVSKEVPDSLIGGIGFYEFKSWRTAFVHTDTRGYAARWGNFLSSRAEEPKRDGGGKSGVAVAIGGGSSGHQHD
ncbi:hypothetical protein BH23VER1_BH23VER1_23430 [soil metagenome]